MSQSVDDILKKYGKPAPTSSSPPSQKDDGGNALFESAFSQLEKDFQTQFKKPFRVTGEDTKMHLRPSLGGRARDIGYRDRTPEEREWIRKRGNELGLDVLESDGTEKWSSGKHGHVEAKDPVNIVLGKYGKAPEAPSLTTTTTTTTSATPTIPTIPTTSIQEKQSKPIPPIPRPTSTSSSTTTPPSPVDKRKLLLDFLKSDMTVVPPSPSNIKRLSTTHRGEPKRTPTLYGTTSGEGQRLGKDKLLENATSAPGAVDQIMSGLDIASRPFQYTSTLVAGLQRHIGAALSDIVSGDDTYKNYSIPKILEAAAHRFYTGEVPPGYEQPVAEVYKLLVQKYGGDVDSTMNQLVKNTLEIGTDPTNIGIGRAVAPKVLKKTFTNIPKVGRLPEEAFISPEKELEGLGRTRTEEEVLKKYGKSKPKGEVKVEGSVSTEKVTTPIETPTTPVETPPKKGVMAQLSDKLVEINKELETTPTKPKLTEKKSPPEIEVPKELTKDIKSAISPTTTAKKGDLELKSTVSHKGVRGGKPLTVEADLEDAVLLKTADGVDVILPKSHPAYTEIVDSVKQAEAKEKIAKQAEITKKKELKKKEEVKVETKAVTPKPKLEPKPKKTLAPKPTETPKVVVVEPSKPVEPELSPKSKELQAEFNEWDNETMEGIKKRLELPPDADPVAHLQNKMANITEEFAKENNITFPEAAKKLMGVKEEPKPFTPTKEDLAIREAENVASKKKAEETVSLLQKQNANLGKNSSSLTYDELPKGVTRDDLKNASHHGLVKLMEEAPPHTVMFSKPSLVPKGTAKSAKVAQLQKGKLAAKEARDTEMQAKAAKLVEGTPTPVTPPPTVKPSLVKKADIPTTTSTKPSVKSPFKNATDDVADDLTDAQLQSVIENPSSFTKDQLYNANWEANYRKMNDKWTLTRSKTTPLEGGTKITTTTGPKAQEGITIEGPQSLDEAAAAATKRLKDIIKGTEGEETRGFLGGRLSPLSSTRSIKDMSIVGAKYLDEGIRNFSAWSERMIDDFGEDIRGQLKNVYILADDELFKSKGIEYRNMGLNLRAAIHSADNLNILPNSPRLPAGSLASFRTQYIDDKGYTKAMASPLSRAGVKGQYELKDPLYGKQLSEAFRNAQHNTEDALLEYQKIQHKIAENLDKAFRNSGSTTTLFPGKLKSLVKGAQGKTARDDFMRDFISTIEKDFTDPSRIALLNSNTPLGNALKLHDDLTKRMRDYIVSTQKSLGRDLPADWGITEKGYYRHLFLGNIQIFENSPTMGKVLRTTVPNYAEAQKWFFEELKTNPNINVEAVARDVFNGDPTLRVTTKKLYKFLGQVSDTIENVSGIKITTADLHEDLRGVVGREAAKQKQLGALFKREDYSGFSTDYHNVMTIHAEQLARSQELSKLNKEVQNIKAHLTSIGKSGLAEEAQQHLNHLWGTPSTSELRFGNWIRKTKILRNVVDNPDTALRNLAQRMASINNTIKLDWNIRSATVNHFQPLTTLYPYTTSKQYASYYASMLNPKTWTRLRDLGVLGTSSKLEVGAAKKTLFNLASDFNRGMGYLHGEADALRLGKTGKDAHRWAKEWAERVEFDNSKWNVSRILRSPSAKIIGQYKGFLFKDVETLFGHTLLKQPGDTFKTLGTRRVKALGSRLALGGLNVGLKAIPFAISAHIIDGLSSKLQTLGMDKSTSDSAATAVVYGAPSLIGLDLSGSFSLVDLFGNTPKEMAASLLAGPTVGMGFSIAENYDDPKKLLERISPYPRSASRFYDILTAEGRQSKVSLDQTKELLLTRYETIMEALGFPSVRRSIFYEDRKAGINPVTGVKKEKDSDEEEKEEKPKRLIKTLRRQQEEEEK